MLSRVIAVCTYNLNAKENNSNEEGVRTCAIRRSLSPPLPAHVHHRGFADM